MATKARSKRLDYAAYLVVRLFVCLVQVIPPRWAFGLADLFARLACRIDRRHREVARDNLTHAFPELAGRPEKLDRLVRDVYRHFGRVLVEMILLPRHFHATNWDKKLELTGGAELLGALTGERPVLLVTGHVGNWELAGYVLGVFGFKTYAIARRLDNPYLERFLKRFRQATGQTILAKKDDYDRITAVLANRGVLGVLADQDAGQKGLFVDFLGRPASTHKAVALMALDSGAVLLVVGVPRVAEPDVYRVVVEDVIRPEEYAGRPDGVRAITQRYTSALERLVRRHPEQYFWLHRRWKHQPKERVRRQVA